jgi:hypothetical protein
LRLVGDITGFRILKNFIYTKMLKDKPPTQQFLKFLIILIASFSTLAKTGIR